MSIAKPKRIKDAVLLAEFRTKPCLICGNKSDPCHIKSKGSGGGDEVNNLINLCRLHHRESHDVGWFKFSQKFSCVLDVLNSKGWMFDTTGKYPKLIRIGFVFL